MDDQKAKLRVFIHKAYKLLQQQKAYTQISVVSKLKTLGVKVSTTNFSNIIKDKSSVGIATLRMVQTGIQQITADECGLQYDDEQQQFIPIANWVAGDGVTILETPIGDNDPWRAITPHWNGRPDIQHKVDFIKTAEREVIEVGVRLNTFTGYFLHRSDHEFRHHIEQLLEKKVKLKLYLLQPSANVTLHYFSDRGEGDSNEVIQKVIKKLEEIKKEFTIAGYGEHFQVYTYQHIPHNHFLIVDGTTRKGKMMVSHYLYGIKRANAPVIEFTKTANRDLFKRYYNSFLALTKDAKQLF